MSFDQIKFSAISWEHGIEHGGIAMYDTDGVLNYVIDCVDGTCYYPDEISILSHYNNWIDISDAVVGDEI